MGKTKKHSPKKHKLKHKSKKQKKTIKRKHTAKQIIELLNLSLKHIYNNKVNIFNTADYLLSTSGYLEQGMKKGFKLLHSENELEASCNELCATISILNHKLLKKSYDKFTDYEKLYLFCLSYLIKNKNGEKLSPSYAIRKTEKRIENEKKRYDIKSKEYPQTHRIIKRSLQTITRLENIKKDLINGNKDKNSHLFTIDLCNNIDCEYLHEYKINKGEPWKKTFSLFCENITEIFKGIIWINMCCLFGGFSKPKDIYLSKQILPLHIDIRDTMGKELRDDIILIPEKEIYDNPDIYITKNDLKLFNKGKPKPWVYANLDLKKNTIDKIAVEDLKKKQYISIQLLGNYLFSDPEDIRKQKSLKMITNFIEGNGKLPVIQKLFKKEKSLLGKTMNTLNEEIINSISAHWIVIPQKRLKPFITENILN